MTSRRIERRSHQDASQTGIVDVVVVGAATRDLTRDEPRGWRLGGAVAYGSLTLARMGLRAAAIVGVDAAAEAALELDLLRAAGVQVHLVPLAHGPVFENVETADGRRQVCLAAADPMPVVLPARIEQAARPRAWLFAPVADELRDPWADVPEHDTLVALGWQGLLRQLAAGQPVSRRPPASGPLVARAMLIGLSGDDLEPTLPLKSVVGLLRPDATLAITLGTVGGLILAGDGHGVRRWRRYPALTSRVVVDPTGAGDAFLAALLGARLLPERADGRSGPTLDVLVAAAVASLVVEAPGLAGVPTRSAIRERVGEWRLGAHRA